MHFLSPYFICVKRIQKTESWLITISLKHRESIVMVWYKKS